MSYKIVSVVGARPQFVKAAAMNLAFAEQHQIRNYLIHTGQHFDDSMSEVFFREMGLPQPDVNLGIHSLSHAAMCGRMMEAIEHHLKKQAPDAVMVYGDTNSTLAAALAAAKMHIPVAHIEAGLRSFDMNMPEEINRVLTDRISTWLFCPTDNAVNQLKKESIASVQIFNSGDIMYDAALHFSDKAQKPDKCLPDNFSLVTLHRAGNTDDFSVLNQLLAALEDIASDQKLVWPMHPRTKGQLKKAGISLSENIFAIEPVSYLEMLYLLQNAEIVLTDSGGLQKEAYFFAKPCITLRNETEWTETLQQGMNVVCGHSHQKIKMAFYGLKNKKPEFITGIYGDGNSANQILNKMLSAFAL